MSRQEVTRKKIEHYSYALGDLIGTGYSSQVFRGRDDLSLLPVALKVIDMKGLKNEVHRTLLMNEIDCLKDLRAASHCIRLLDVYTTKNNTYLVTELCDGDLARLILRGPLPEHRALLFMRQILQGYLELQDKGIVHRDIKPANVFLSGDSAKIADFGFAVRAQTDEPARYSYNVGSPLYMPPEALCSNLYSFRSDIWALGVIFFEMLAGKTPWLARTEKELEQKIRNEPLDLLIPPSWSSVCSGFIRRCLDINPETRLSPPEIRTWLKELPGQSQAVSPLAPSNVNSPPGEGGRRKEAGPGFQEQCKVVVAQINFCRFMMRIAKIFEQLEKGEMEKTAFEVRALLGKSMVVTSARLGSMVAYKLNPLRLQDFPQFAESREFQKVRRLVEEYAEKYRLYLDSLGVKMYLASEDVRLFCEEEGSPAVLQRKVQEVCRRLCAQLRGAVAGGEQYEIHEAETKGRIVGLDYLVTLWQLNSMAQKEDFGYFARHSQIQAIMEGRPSSVTSEHFARIESKLSKLHFLND